MRINTNLNAMTALNSATKNTALAGSSMEKLSSGLKINKAADNATGLAISEKMRSQIRGLDQASQNTQDGISVVQTAEGAIEEVGNIVQRMRELAVQGANETNTGSDRAKISEELTQLHEEIDRIAESTQFNGKDLLNGTNTVRTEVNAKVSPDNSKVSDIKVDSGFDFDELTGITNNTGDIKVQTVANETKIKLNGEYLPAGYEFTVDNGIQDKGQNPKIGQGSTITITDTNGKKVISNILGPNGSFVKWNTEEATRDALEWENQGEASDKGITFNENRDMVFPIPLYEITMSNGSITQNPGWN